MTADTDQDCGGGGGVSTPTDTPHPHPHPDTHAHGGLIQHSPMKGLNAALYFYFELLANKSLKEIARDSGSVLMPYQMNPKRSEHTQKHNE